MLTLNQIKKLCPKNKQPQLLVDTLNKFLPLYGITSKEQIACFLSQCGHESAGFSKLSENLNYSAAGLHDTWKKRFPTVDSARAYHRNPEKIANKVYCDRLGNGCEASGDGWKYRGRGLIAITGKYNYQKFADYIKKPLSECVDYCATLEGAVESACWFWKENNLNRFVDTDNFEGLTKAINGGLIGYSSRKVIYDQVKNLIN